MEAIWVELLEYTSLMLESLTALPNPSALELALMLEGLAVSSPSSSVMGRRQRLARSPQAE